MKIHVPGIPEEGVELDEEVSVESEVLREPAQVRLKLMVQRSGGEVYVSGLIAADIVLGCSRCLGDFSKDISVPVEVVYRPAGECGPEGRGELLTGELDTGYYDGDELDIAELAREQVLLDVSMKPLCSDSCKGICLKCGKDLNEEGPCGCVADTGDPRWGALKKLLPEGGSD